MDTIMNLASDAGPNTSSLSDKEIHALLAERLEYKMNRQFRDADAIQDELIQAGVHVHDGNKEWRADGERFQYGNNGDRGMRNSDRGGGGRSINPISNRRILLPAEDDEEIQDLVDQRMDAKRVRDYHVADELRDVLRADYNVEVNDKLRQWSVGGDFGIPTRDRNYAISPDSEIPENANEIQQLVEERNEARKVRDFDTADAIRDDLLDQNIMVDDKLCQWAVGGRFSQGNKWSFAAQYSLYQAWCWWRLDGGTRSVGYRNLFKSVLLLNEKSNLVKQIGFETSYKRTFKVRVDDRSREWHVVSEKYANMSPFDLNEDDQTLIEEKIVQRAVAKLEKDYDTADAIRDELAETYNVDIDDRLREWRVIGTSGSPPSSSAMGDV